MCRRDDHRVVAQYGAMEEKEERLRDAERGEREALEIDRLISLHSTMLSTNPTSPHSRAVCDFFTGRFKCFCCSLSSIACPYLSLSFSLCALLFRFRVFLHEYTHLVLCGLSMLLGTFCFWECRTIEILCE